MSGNPNPAFIIIPGPFGAYSSQVSGAIQPSIPAGLVSPGVTGYYQYISNGVANPNYPDANNTAVGK